MRMCAEPSFRRENPQLNSQNKTCNGGVSDREAKRRKWLGKRDKGVGNTERESEREKDKRSYKKKKEMKPPMFWFHWLCCWNLCTVLGSTI